MNANTDIRDKCKVNVLDFYLPWYLYYTVSVFVFLNICSRNGVFCVFIELKSSFITCVLCLITFTLILVFVKCLRDMY